MINKLLIHVVYALAVLSLTSVAQAELPASQQSQEMKKPPVNQPTTKTMTDDEEEFSAFEFDEPAATETKGPATRQARPGPAGVDTEQHNSIPSDWYEPY